MRLTVEKALELEEQGDTKPIKREFRFPTRKENERNREENIRAFERSNRNFAIRNGLVA